MFGFFTSKALAPSWSRVHYQYKVDPPKWPNNSNAFYTEMLLLCQSNQFKFELQMLDVLKSVSNWFVFIGLHHDRQKCCKISLASKLLRRIT